MALRSLFRWFLKEQFKGSPTYLHLMTYLCYPIFIFFLRCLTWCSLGVFSCSVKNPWDFGIQVTATFALWRKSLFQCHAVEGIFRNAPLYHSVRSSVVIVFQSPHGRTVSPKVRSNHSLSLPSLFTFYRSLVKYQPSLFCPIPRECACTRFKCRWSAFASNLYNDDFNKDKDD